MTVNKEMIEAFYKAHDAALELQPRENHQAVYAGLETALSRSAEAGKPVVKVSVPDGWQLVPKKPDEEMIAAAFDAHEPLDGNDEDFRAEFKRTYRAMLAAAPQPNPSAVDAEMKRLRKALAPFAKLAKNYSNFDAGDAVFAKGCAYVYELREAEAALASEGKKP